VTPFTGPNREVPPGNKLVEVRIAEHTTQESQEITATGAYSRRSSISLGAGYPSYTTILLPLFLCVGVPNHVTVCSGTDWPLPIRSYQPKNLQVIKSATKSCWKSISFAPIMLSCSRNVRNRASDCLSCVGAETKYPNVSENHETVTTAGTDSVKHRTHAVIMDCDTGLAFNSWQDLQTERKFFFGMWRAAPVQ
jgi:hypothetical protein